LEIYFSLSIYFLLSIAHFKNASISYQAIAIGKSQTGVKTLYLHQTSSEITKVLNQFLSAKSFKIHLFLSVIATTLFETSSFEYL
jgi:hypothetical protein